MTDVVIAGGISRDHIVSVERELAAFNQPGGPGYYAALAAALVARSIPPDAGEAAITVGLCADVRDADLRGNLARGGVDLSQTTSEHIAQRLWILDAPEGRRVLSTARGTHELDPADPQTDGVDVTPNLDGAGVLLRCAPTSPMADLGTTTVVVDPDQSALAAGGWSYLAAVAPPGSVLLPSRVHLGLLGEGDVLRTARVLRERTGCSVVARLDADGSVVLPGSGGMWRVHAPAEVVDTTGAGDSHAGGLAAALAAKGTPGEDGLVDAARWASAVARRVLGAPGAQALLDGPLTDLEHAIVTVSPEGSS